MVVSRPFGMGVEGVDKYGSVAIAKSNVVGR
jgi:hypothetical protein